MFLEVIQYTNSKILAGLIIDSDIYVPADRNFQQLDLNTDRKIAYNLACNIQQCLIKFLRDAKTHNQLSPNKISKNFQFYILERQTTNIEKNNQDEDMNTYVRFGYHIYFPHVLVNYDNKKILKELLCKELITYFQTEVKPIYKTTQFGEYMDTQPFVATTSLPLTFPNLDKCYTKFLIMQNNQLTVYPVTYYPQFVADLDMFNGIECEIQSQYLQNIKTNTLQNLILKYQIPDYKTALYYAHREFDKQQIANKQIIDICVQFNHIRDTLIRQEFIKLLYQYLNHNEYLTQLGYFIAMAGDDIISMQDILILYAQMQIDEDYRQQQSMQSTTTQNSFDSSHQNPTFQWMIDMKERDRGPLKSQDLVQKIIKQYDQSKEPEDPLIQIIAQFNNNIQYKINNNLIAKEDAVKYKQTSGIYDDFMKYKITCYNGFFSKIDIERILPVQFKAFFLQFLNMKLKQSLITYIDKQGNRFLYQFNDTDTSQDHFHYKIIDKDDYMAIISSYIENFIDDYSYIQTERGKQHTQYNNSDNLPTDEKAKTNNNTTFLLSIIQMRSTIKQSDYEQCLAQLNQVNIQKQPDQEKGIFGVYNGLLQWDDNIFKFKYITGKDARNYFITQSTMLKIQPWMLNENGYLKDIDELEHIQDIEIQHFIEAYKQIEQIFLEMYMQNIDILQWKITQIILRMLYHEITCQGIFVLYCSGANGKTTQSQTIMNWLGQKQQKINDLTTGEQRYIHKGYIGSAKSAILQTSNSNSAQHDSGGLAELEGAAYACMTELDSQYPIINAQVKTLCSDTNFAVRQAYAKTSVNMVNRAFIELQTNTQIKFNQGLDYGTARRFYQYKLIKTFVSKEQYIEQKNTTLNKIKENPEQEEELIKQFNRDYGIKDETLISKLCNIFSYIDAGNYYCLMTFQKFYRQHHARDYIPKILLDSQLTMMQENHKLFSIFYSSLTPDKKSDILYSSLIEQLYVFIKDRLREHTRQQIQQQFEDYEYLVKNKFINDLFAIDKKTKNIIHININQFPEYESNEQYIIILKNYRFIDPGTQSRYFNQYKTMLIQNGFE